MKFKVRLAYDGSDFLGWQKQGSKRSVQGELEKVLSKIAKREIRVHGSGRTDAKVHALAQVFHFESGLNMDADAWFRALTSLAPKDIAIRDVCEVDEAFHAQYHAKAKTYKYRLNMGDYDPFMRRYENQLGVELDCDAMGEVMDLFVGTHDFTSFNATELSVVPDQVRTVHSFTLYQAGDHLDFQIHGSGFLRYMVRMLIAACIEVGRGKLRCADIEHYLNAKDKNVFARNADACGLYLVEVVYDEGWEIDNEI